MNIGNLDDFIVSREKESIHFLQDILRIPSVTGNEGPIQEFIGAHLTRLGLAVDSFVPALDALRKHPAFVEVDVDSYEGRPNVVAVLKGEGGGRSLLFNGHVDVIPEGSSDNWEHGCWSADIADGKMYGRGAADMKSGVAAMTMAVKLVRDAGIKLKGDVILEYVMDEELSGNGTLACVTKGYRADAGICCETSSMRVQPGSIGRIWFTINIKGKAAGIQRRYEGVNAIDLGYLVTKAVSEFEKERVSKIRHPLYPDILASIPCMIGQFSSGTYASAFPDSCTLKGSMATVPGEDSDAVKSEFVRFITQRVSEQEPWFKDHPPAVIFNGYFAEPAAIDVESPIVTELCGSFAAVMGKVPVISGREGAADIRHLVKYGNTPTVIFGPGMTEQMHANNEWVNLADYLHAIRILARTIVSWCGIAE
ncbi:MAG: ArgE/DapE family deacylase [Candidatus Pelethousia sp.]|nr:ArgE/DapE family deacylase [Candidatus Pelethousia sp.]